MHRTITSLAAVAALVLIVSAHPSGQKPSAFSFGSVLPTLDVYLESLRQQAGIPGMSALIVNEGTVIWEKGYGFANLTTRERATPDTPYLVGDVSETLAAVLLLQCVEQRHLDLDERFDRYGLSSPEPDATLRGLLSHATPDNSKDGFFFSPPRFTQLTALMEGCAPQPYRKSVQHRILDHLAMRDSVPGTDLEDPDLQLPDGMFEADDLDRYRKILSKIAVPYKVMGRGKTERTELPPVPMTAADGLVSTVRDLAEFDKALTRDEGALLLPDTLVGAWNPVTTRTGATSPMGLGWFVQLYHDERVVWTFGNVTNAYSALVLKLPARNTTFILLANSDGLSAPFQLNQGDVTRSVFATLFLKLTT